MQCTGSLHDKWTYLTEVGLKWTPPWIKEDQIRAAYLLNWIGIGQILVKGGSVQAVLVLDSRQSIGCCFGVIAGKPIIDSTLSADSWQRGSHSASSALSILLERAKISRRNISLVTFRWWKDSLVTTRPLSVPFLSQAQLRILITKVGLQREWICEYKQNKKGASSSIFAKRESSFVHV